MEDNKEIIHEFDISNNSNIKDNNKRKKKKIN